jgi:hypothetical protein
LCWAALWAVGSWNTRWGRWWWWCGLWGGRCAGTAPSFPAASRVVNLSTAPWQQMMMGMLIDSPPPLVISCPSLRVGVLVVCPRWAHAGRAQARTKGANRAAIRASSQVAPYQGGLCSLSSHPTFLAFSRTVDGALYYRICRSQGPRHGAAVRPYQGGNKHQRRSQGSAPDSLKSHTHGGTYPLYSLALSASREAGQARARLPL